jgi:carbonic anhydrase
MNLDHLIQSNRQWAQAQLVQNPTFFDQLRSQHVPGYLWIGCSDARVPATQIVDLAPGEMFVHRNIANQVIHTDINCLSVLQYGVETLGIKDIIVCGHYGCGGVRGALASQPLGLIDNWLRHLRDIITKHQAELDAQPDAQARENRLCELNVIEQVHNLCHTTIVQDAWAKGHPLSVHGWIYGLNNGHVNDLNVSISRPQDINAIYRLSQNPMSA